MSVFKRHLGKRRVTARIRDANRTHNQQQFFDNESVRASTYTITGALGVAPALVKLRPPLVDSAQRQCEG